MLFSPSTATSIPNSSSNWRSGPFFQRIGFVFCSEQKPNGNCNAFPIRFKRTSGSSRQPGSNRNDSGRRHRSKRKKLLRNEPGQSRPKSAPVSRQPFTRSCAGALNGRRNCTNQPGPVCSTGTNFLLCNNFIIAVWLRQLSLK